MAIPVLVVAATYTLIGPSVGLGLGLVALLLVPALVSRRIELNRASQILLTMVLFAAGIAFGTSVFVPAISVPAGMLRLGWSASVLTLLLVCVGRLWTARPLGGQVTTLLLALFACAACGGSDSGALYPTSVAAFLLAAGWARRQADPTRGPWSRSATRPMVALSLAVLLAVGAAAGANRGLPRLHDWVVKQILRSGALRSGFTTRMSLGSISGLWESDEVVLRVRGAETDYLRGASFVRYEQGRWSAGHDEPATRVVLPRSLPAGAGATQVELVTLDPERYFLPLEAVDVAVATGIATVDRDGMLIPLAAAPAQLYAFRTSTRPPARPRPPDADDRFIEPRLAGRLRPLALAWTLGAETTEAQLAALTVRLHTEYEYSLDVPQPAGDPILHFLLVSRRGHCEYFASALALLGRSLDIPTRVVAGYRAVERNELGDYTIVRERHAHAWVEAWAPGEGWQPYDATPPAAAGAPTATTTPLFGALLDWARSGWAKGLRWLDRRTPLEIAAALLGLVLLGITFRALRALLERRRRAPEAAIERAPDWFAAVERALGGHGIARAAHEPLEWLPRRAADVGLSPELTVALGAFVAGYAAFRYGGIGDAAKLEAAARGLTRRLVAHGSGARAS